MVVADSLERAQHAATLVQVSYAETPSVTTIDQGRADAYVPDKIFGGFIPGRMERGNVDDGLAAADVRVDAPFRFAANHHNPIEALTTTAVWDGDQLTLYDSCQGIKAVQLTVAALLGHVAVEGPGPDAVCRRRVRLQGDGLAARDSDGAGRSVRPASRPARAAPRPDVHLVRAPRGAGAAHPARGHP